MFERGNNKNLELEDRRTCPRAYRIARDRPGRIRTPLQAQEVVRPSIKTQQTVEAVVRRVAAQASVGVGVARPLAVVRCRSIGRVAPLRLDEEDWDGVECHQQKTERSQGSHGCRCIPDPTFRDYGPASDHRGSRKGYAGGYVICL